MIIGHSLMTMKMTITWSGVFNKLKFDHLLKKDKKKITDSSGNKLIKLVLF